MATSELICVPPSRVAEFWPFARPLIKRAIDRVGLTAFEDVEQPVLDGRALLWIAWDGKIEAAATTEIYHDALVVVACGGEDMDRWLHLLKPIEEYGRKAGCKRSRIIGRKGWARVLPDYKTEFHIMEKAL